MRTECTVDNTICFLIGVGVGAATALLMAPQSGRRTRRQLVRRAEDVQEHLEELGEELIERGRELVERGRSGIDEKLKKA